MKENPYYDFQRLNIFLNGTLSPRNSIAESSFIYFLAHFVPFYTLEDDPTLVQTIEDFSRRKNVIYPLAQEFLKYCKKEIFTDDPTLLDHPMVLGNLINIAFGYYVIKHPFPTIQRLVVGPRDEDRSVKQLEAKVMEFFKTKMSAPEYATFINEDTIQLIADAYSDVILPYFDRAKYAKKVVIGVALEHNFLLVKNLYQILSDLRFTQGEPFDAQRHEEYDLIISSSLILKNHYPDLPIFLWDHDGDMMQYIKLYQKLRELFVEKNR